MKKKLHFPDRFKKQLRPLVFAALGFGVLSACPSVKIVKEPLKSYQQMETGNAKHAAVNWKDGECWIEGKDTIVYSYQVGENSVETKRFKTGVFLEKDEEAKEIKCSEKGTYILTDRNIVMLVGASKVYFGKDDFYLSKGIIKLDEMKGKIIDWIAANDEICFLTADFFRYSDLHSDNNLDFEHKFNDKSKMIRYKGFVFVIRPGEKDILFAFDPRTKEGELHSVSRKFDGKISFQEVEDWLEVSIGKSKIAIEIEKGKVRVSWL